MHTVMLCVEIQGPTDKGQKKLAAALFIGLGTMNFDEMAGDAGEISCCVQFGTHNSHPLLLNHVSKLVQEISNHFLLDEQIAIHLPVLWGWLDTTSLQKIEAMKTADWGNPDVLTQLPAVITGWLKCYITLFLCLITVKS